MRVFIARSIALLFAILFWVWFAFKFVIDWVGRTTVVDDYNQLVERLPMVAAFLVATPWWIPAGSAATLTAFLLWAGWPTERVTFWTSRKDKYRSLGLTAMHVAHRIRQFEQFGKFVDNGAALQAEIFAVFVRFHDLKFPIPVPGKTWNQQQKIDMALEYLSLMGPLLRDGSFDEAKYTARELAAKSPQSEVGDTDRF